MIDNRLILLLLSSVLLLINGVFTDTLFVNESLLSLRVDTFTENVLVKGYHRHYIRLKNREKIIVTCAKTNAHTNGTIMAFVNTKLATQVKCLHYHRDLIADDNFCQAKQFVAYVEADQSSFVEIWCRMLYDSYKQEASANLFLSRLYEDNEPRIRNGLTLTSLDSTVTHLVNVETISCEATKDRADHSSAFDSLAWFTADSTFALTPEPSKRYELVNINDQFVNYTSLFPLDSSLLRNNSVYKCCTLFDGKIRSCQRFLAYIYAPPPSTTTTTTTTTTIITTTITTTVDTNITETMESGSSAGGFLAVWNKNRKDRPNFKIFEGIEDRDFDSGDTRSGGLSSSNSASSSQVSDAEIAIIVGSVAGTIIILMIILLAVLCYRKYRYDQIYLKKDQISDLQSTINRTRKGQLIPRVELRMRPLRIDETSVDDSVRNTEPIRAYADNTLDDTGSWTTNLGAEEIRRLRLQQALINASRADQQQQQIQQGSSATRLVVGASTSMGVVMMSERNYERVDPTDMSMLTTSGVGGMSGGGVGVGLATSGGLINTPRLMDPKEQKRREKEMRRLAKLRIEAELKEAKLQAKLAKKQAKCGEPVALGILQTFQTDDLDIDLYGVPRLQRVSIDDSRKSLGASMKNREKSNSINSSIHQQDHHIQQNPQHQQSSSSSNKKTNISNISFVPPPFASPSLPPPPPPPSSGTTNNEPKSNRNSSSLYSRTATSYPRQQPPLPLPIRDNNDMNNNNDDQYHLEQVSPGGENNNIQETVYVSPTDNQIELVAATSATAFTTKRRSSNGQGNIENSNLLY